jgi:toxin-antitoxin system PIN domain toxin
MGRETRDYLRRPGLIAVDTNILVYAYRRDTPQHVAAAGAVAELAEGAEPWAIPWPCVHEFLAFATNQRLQSRPLPTDAALLQVEEWLRAPAIALLAEGPGYADELSALLRSSGATGGRVHDARIAALCLYHGVSELWTADRDFARFPSLRTRNPLLA